jgi:hypothetical protein
MMEKAICQHTLPQCHSGRGLPIYIAIYSFHSSIRSIKIRFLTNFGVAATEEEVEAGVEVVKEEQEEAGIGGQHRSDGGGNRLKRCRWWLRRQVE